MQGYVEKIHLYIGAVACRHQHFASLLFPWGYTAVEIAARNLPTSMTAD
jgi:hypothetical protein